MFQLIAFFITLTILKSRKVTGLIADQARNSEL